MKSTLNITKLRTLNITKLSDNAVIVLAALNQAIENATSGEFGFMDEAYQLLDSEKISPKQFSGYCSALSDYIEFSEIISAANCNSPAHVMQTIQFMVTSEVWDARSYISEIADGLLLLQAHR